MAMLSSCSTLLTRAPAPGKSSPAAALQLRSRQQAAASVMAPLRWASSNESQSRRAARFACHAYDYKDIQPSALVHPREKNDGDWRLKEEEDQLTLKFNVGTTTKPDELEVKATDDQTLLRIRYKKEDKSSPASSLDVHLLMPPGYDSNKMRARIAHNGYLEISIPKPPKKSKPMNISQEPAPESTAAQSSSSA